MRLIGLCGRSGSGKGVFCSVARENGFTVIDCDAVYKSLVSHPSPCLLEIADSFGPNVIKDNALDRRYLAPIVFSDAQKLKLLNEITHKYISAEVNKILASLPEDAFVVLDAPALFESGMDKLCNLIVGIVAPDDQCVLRITARDGVSTGEALSRLSKQLSVEEIVSKSNHVLYNNSTVESFKHFSLLLLNSIKEGSV